MKVKLDLTITSLEDGRFESSVNLPNMDFICTRIGSNPKEATVSVITHVFTLAEQQIYSRLNKERDSQC